MVSKWYMFHIPFLIIDMRSCEQWKERGLQDSGVEVEIRYRTGTANVLCDLTSVEDKALTLFGEFTSVDSFEHHKYTKR